MSSGYIRYRMTNKCSRKVGVNMQTFPFIKIQSVFLFFTLCKLKLLLKWTRGKEWHGRTTCFFLVSLRVQPGFPLCQHTLHCLRRKSHEREREREREKRERERERERERGTESGDDLGLSDCGVALLPTCAEEISSSAEEPTWQTLTPRGSKAGHSVFPQRWDRLYTVHRNTVPTAYATLPFKMCTPPHSVPLSALYTNSF